MCGLNAFWQAEHSHRPSILSRAALSFVPKAGLVQFHSAHSAGHFRQKPPTLWDADFWYTSRSRASGNALIDAMSALLRSGRVRT